MKFLITFFVVSVSVCFAEPPLQRDPGYQRSFPQNGPIFPQFQPQGPQQYGNQGPQQYGAGQNWNPNYAPSYGPAIVPPGPGLPPGIYQSQYSTGGGQFGPGGHHQWSSSGSSSFVVPPPAPVFPSHCGPQPVYPPPPPVVCYPPPRRPCPPHPCRYFNYNVTFGF